MSLILCCACCVPQSAKATDCHRQNVVFNDHVEYVVQDVDYVVAVPHTKVVERVIFNNEYDYEPVAVERVVKVEKIVKQRQRVPRQRVRVQRQNVKRVRIVERQEVHY